MNNRVKGLLVTVAAVLLCGFPGLFIGVFITGRLIAGSAPGMYPSTASIAIIGASVILMLIPVGVGFFTLRKKDNQQ
jgi:hypothetical protein